MTDLPLVSVVVVTRNGSARLRDYLLDSIAQLEYPDFEVVFVDDASSDDTCALLSAYKLAGHDVKVVRNFKNRGISHVRNLGVKHSRGEIVAFVDDDCTLDANWLREIVKPYISDVTVMGVGGLSYVKDTPVPYNPNGKIFGCNMSFRRSVFDRFSFDTNLYFKGCSWYDDSEFIDRLKRYGLKLVYADAATMRHYAARADYRANKDIGKPLNRFYWDTKYMNLLVYYGFVIGHFLHARQKHWRYFLTAVFEIPYKAKLRRLQDRFSARFGRPDSWFSKPID